MTEIYLAASARLAIWDTLRGQNEDRFLKKLRPLLKKHSHVSLEFSDPGSYETDDEKIGVFTAILDKIVSRGNPTLSDKGFEDRLLAIPALSNFEFKQLEETTNQRLVGEKIVELPQDVTLNDLLQEAGHLFYLRFDNKQIDHQLNQGVCDELRNLTSDEEDIFFGLIGEKISPKLQCLFNRQTLITDLIGHDDENVRENRVDFSLHFGELKLVLEIDSEDHKNDPEIRNHDEVRDQVLQKNGWEVIRIPARDVRDGAADWLEKLDSKVSAQDILFNALNHVLLKDQIKSPSFLTIVYPHLVHRSLKALIQSIRFERFPMKNGAKILVLEEDVPAAGEALCQLYELWDNLKIIAPQIPSSPELTIHVIGHDFIYALPKIDKLKFSRKKEPEQDYELCISHSFTLFSGQKGLLEEEILKTTAAKESIRIRTAPIQREYRELLPSLPINFDLEDLERALISQSTDEPLPIPQDKYDALRYFLQNIFRKYDFWDGQARVISRLLRGESSIVLLPTGGGKSLTYQFTGLLLPGVTLIVDPLVSLITDQVENLSLMGFDRAGFISSILEPHEREVELKKIGEGRFYYVFVAPERLQMEEFRNQLRTLVAQNPVSLAVIDEVHCVSEWGHDFRPSYLHLGMNLEKYCTPEGGKKPTLVGLTGTASFAVLTDVQMELNIKEEQAVVRPSSFDRNELIFHVEPVESVGKPAQLRIIKNRMPRDFQRIPQVFFQLRGENTNCGIIFCPHASGKSSLGVVKVASYMGHGNYYAGGKPKGLPKSEKEWRDHKINVQKGFKYSRIQELVATKSFGMGIDKPNIRYTIHYTIPHSVEAFYQEAGRAGRDGRERSAHCYVIYSDDNWDLANEIINLEDHKKAVQKLEGVNWDDRGDLLHQLWFLFNTYQDRESEKAYTFRLWVKKFHPAVQTLPLNGTNTVPLKFGNDRYRNALEKAIFRLVQLGVVEDYSIDWRLRSFKVRVVKREPEYVRSKLKDFYLKYKFEKFAEENTNKIPTVAVDQTLEACLGRMIDFVYDEIVEKRKQALRTMADLCRNFESDQQFRKNILAYLQESEFTEILRTWIDQPFDNIGFRAIYDVLTQVQDLEQSRRLIGTCQRMLDEDPSNIGLRFLSCCARTRSSVESDSSVEQECITLINQMAKQYETLSQRVEILLRLVDELSNERSELVYGVLERILRVIGARDFIRAYLKVRPTHDNEETMAMMNTLLAARALKTAINSNFYQSLVARR